MTPAGVARRFERMAEQLGRELVRAEEATRDLALQEAVRLSSGTTSSKELRRIGHPYARRHRGKRGRPALPAPDHIINRQGGDFLRDWVGESSTYTEGVLLTVVRNKNRVADLLAKGTPTMIRRRLTKRLRERIRAARSRNLRQALRNSMKAR